MTTYNTIQSLIISFEDNYHLPLLAAVNTAYITGSAESLIEACNMTQQGMDALEHLQASCERLMKRESALTTGQVWEIANSLEELTNSLKYITAELAELSLDIAEEYALCNG